MKAALLHLELGMGPTEKNISKLQKAVKAAATKGAEWIVTPEVAVEGYYFKRINPDYEIKIQPGETLQPITELVSACKVILFLGCAEHDPQTNANYNSCLVFGAEGSLLGRHRKLIAPHGTTESWATKSEVKEPVLIGSKKVGALVCADAWYVENAVAMQEKGAELLIDIAAWPPTPTCGDPLPAWKKCSEATGLPLWVCNQTGWSEWMDMTVGLSAVIENGNLKISYKGDEAILLFDWSEAENKLLSDNFEVLKFDFEK